MDSPPALETVHQAVFSLFHNPNSTDTEKANLWLAELQKSVYAWKIADELLHAKRDLESCYFAAQTLRTKIQSSFHELPANVHESLRDSLLEHISLINENTDKIIVVQLCIALSDLALQMTSWQDPVMDLINKFGQTTTSMWPLLETLTVLPEEVNSWHLRLGDNRRQQIMQYFFNIGHTLASYLEMCLKNVADNLQMHIRILRCFTSWVSVNAISFRQMQNSSIVAYAFEALNNHMVGSNLHVTATECVCTILQVLDKDGIDHQQNNGDMAMDIHLRQLLIYQKIITLEQPYHFSVAHEDMEKSQNYCRIFTELAETFLETMVDESTPQEPHYSIKVLDFALMCVGHHDYEVAQITFNLWYRLSEILYQKNNEELNTVFIPHIERLLGVLCRHCQMEPDHLGLVEEEGGGGKLFAEFRARVSELIKDVVFVVGSSHCFRQMFVTLTGGPGPQQTTPTWDSIEAALFVMQSVAKNILPEENDVVPKVVEAILNLPENTHIAVKHTSILLLGELCEWIDSHVQSLEPVLNFLLSCLSQKGLGSASLVALHSICTACGRHMTSQLSVLLQLANNLENFTFTNTAAIDFLKGISKVLSKTPKDELERAMKELCWIQARSLKTILESEQTVRPEKGSKTDPVIWLNRMAAIFKSVSVDIKDSETHPCQLSVTEMWPILSATLNKYQQDANIMEHSCRCLRFAIRCVGKHALHILQPLVQQIVQLYAAHHHSCFLYLGSILVDEYATSIENVPGLLNMLEAFLGPTFTILQEPNGLVNHPDTVDDLFRLCDRFVQRAPLVILHSQIMSSIFDCALMSCSFDHRDANASVMKFFYHLLRTGRNVKCGSDFTIRQQLVQQIVQEKGQSLVSTLLYASVFSFSTYMLPDISDVLLEISYLNKEQFTKWLEEAIKSMPMQNAGGALTVTPEQQQEFHNTIISTDNTEMVKNALRTFARLYR